MQFEVSSFPGNSPTNFRLDVAAVDVVVCHRCLFTKKNVRQSLKIAGISIKKTLFSVGNVGSRV
jgi:hypothetical protein